MATARLSVLRQAPQPPAPGRRRLEGLALLDDSRFGWAELTLAALLLSAVGIAVYGAHVVKGGFYSDDWSLAALYRFPTPSGHVQDFINISPARPVLALWLVVTYGLFGTHTVPQLAVTLSLGLLASTLFYAVLRTLGVIRLFAWLIAALALLFPSSDADKLWYDASPGMLSVVFCCAGLLLMLAAFEHHGRAALVRHGLSAGFYALSIMTYETTAPVIALSAALLAWRLAPRRDVLRRTGVDLVLTLLILKLVTAQTAKPVALSFGPMWTHAKAIVNQGILVFGESLFPFYSVPEHRLVLAVGLVIVGAGVAVLRLLPAGDRDRELLRHALALTGMGLAVTILGWVILLPSNLVYSPNAGGDGSRVNGTAGFGLVICVFGLLLTCAVLIFRGLTSSPRRTASVVAAAATLIVGAGYAVRITQDVHKWDATQATRSQVLTAIRQAVPHPARGSFIFATGFAEEPYPNIGTFDFPWDLNGAVQIVYDDSSLTGQPLVTAGDLHCGAQQLTPLVAVTQSPIAPVRYAPSVYLINTQSHAVHVITSRNACVAAGGTAS